MIRFISLEILSAGPADAARRRPVHLVYGGRRLEGALQWSDSLDADLAAWSRLTSDEAADARLSAALRSLVLPIWPRVEAELEDARAAGDPARVELILNDLELSGLPWELLTIHSFNLSLAHVPKLQLRYSLSNRPALSVAPGACPVVMGWSGRVPEAEHIAALEAAWGGRFEPAKHAVEADLPRLDALLREASPAVLHLLCHTVEVEPGEYALILRGPTGEARVSPAHMARVLGQHADRLQVVLLCACSGGDAPGIDAVSSVARELHKVGVRAVLSSRLPLSVPGSVVLARRLHERLAAGDSLEEAVLAARADLRVRDGRSRDAEAIQLYAAPGQDTSLALAEPEKPGAQRGSPPPRIWRKIAAIGLGVLALVGLGWIAYPKLVAGERAAPPIDDTAGDAHVELKIVVPSLERSAEVAVARAPDDACGKASAFGSAVLLSRQSWILVGDPSALAGRGHLYTYDKNSVGESRSLARYGVPADAGQISTVGDPLAGAVDGAGLGSAIAEFGNSVLTLAPAASPNGVPPFFEPAEPTEAPSWFGPTLEQALGGQATRRGDGWIARGYSALALATDSKVYSFLFGGEGIVGLPMVFSLEHAFVQGVFQETPGDARSGIGVLASGYGGDCGAGEPCTVLYSFSAARTAWRVGGGPVAVGEFDGESGLDGAVFDVASSTVWILPDLAGRLGAQAPELREAEGQWFKVPGLPEGALTGDPGALSLVSLGTLDGDAVEDLAIGVPFSHLNGRYGEGGVLVSLSSRPDLLYGLRIDNDRVFTEQPAHRAVSLSFDPDFGPGGTLAIGATGLFAADGATSCGGVVVIGDLMALLR